MIEKRITLAQFNAGEIGYMLTPDFAELMHCSVGLVIDWRKHKECPAHISGYVPVVEMLRFLSRRTPTGRSAAYVARAAHALKELERKKPKGMPIDDQPKHTAPSRPRGNTKAYAVVPKEVTKPPPPPPDDTPTLVEKKKSEKGITHALERLRDAEHTLGERFRRQMENEDPDAGLTFRLWKDTMDQLRRMESEIMEITQASGENISSSEAKRAISLICASVKNRLLLIPAQMAHELADRDAPEIQNILNGQIENILDGLSKTVANLREVLR